MEKSKTEGVSVRLTPEKSEEFFHSALCDGISQFACYDLELRFDESVYHIAKEHLTQLIYKGLVPAEMQKYAHKEVTPNSICFEDVLMCILRSGGKLEVFDHNGGEYTRSITMKDVHDKVQETPFRHLSDMIEENSDATTSDVILQTVFFGEVIFG